MLKIPQVSYYCTKISMIKGRSKFNLAGFLLTLRERPWSFENDNIVLSPNCLQFKQWNKIFRKFTFDFDTNSNRLHFLVRDLGLILWNLTQILTAFSFLCQGTRDRTLDLYIYYNSLLSFARDIRERSVDVRIIFQFIFKTSLSSTYFS